MENENEESLRIDLVTDIHATDPFRYLQKVYRKPLMTLRFSGELLLFFLSTLNTI